jgi:hypothetical protein
LPPNQGKPNAAAKPTGHSLKGHGDKLLAGATAASTTGELSQPALKPKHSRRTPEHQTRLYINVGQAMNIAPADVVKTISGETGLPGKVVGTVDIRERHCFVDVASEHVNTVLARLNRAQMKGHKLKVKVA